ncbi:hypothetical protein F1189_24710 [Rhodovastum atsumiense]|uniref:Uncharacterized protein n=1 Tax=Rhodovastum atsumiense TaxID=504468 RepID=A0A5M6IMZ4_9PROT|nr:hypothetical protein F1189_24710 [Rhodovastum atsumiense]
MSQRRNHYAELAADYSRPGGVPEEVRARLIRLAEELVRRKEAELPEIGPDYTAARIEAENREWWPTHCEALRQRRGDILTGEYREDLVYFCQDGPYFGTTAQREREKHWWALIAQPGVTMTWPIVLFWSEFVHFEWAALDDATHETVAKGSVCWVRRGHRGGCYFKSEQLTFYRDVTAPAHLLALVEKGGGA